MGLGASCSIVRVLCWVGWDEGAHRRNAQCPFVHPSQRGRLPAPQSCRHVSHHGDSGAKNNPSTWSPKFRFQHSSVSPKPLSACWHPLLTHPATRSPHPGFSVAMRPSPSECLRSEQCPGTASAETRNQPDGSQPHPAALNPTIPPQNPAPWDVRTSRGHFPVALMAESTSGHRTPAHDPFPLSEQGTETCGHQPGHSATSASSVTLWPPGAHSSAWYSDSALISGRQPGGGDLNTMEMRGAPHST